jgi:hypothetical protein
MKRLLGDPLYLRRVELKIFGGTCQKFYYWLATGEPLHTANIFGGQEFLFTQQGKPLSCKLSLYRLFLAKHKWSHHLL